MKDAISIYESLARPPKEALKEIKGGKLSGMTDINPQWRYKVMTEKFGLVGVGWKYEVQKLWTEQGAKGEVLAFAQVAVFVKKDEQWGEPIIGVGGSKLVLIGKGDIGSNDEGYKMAVTDALGTALKMLGVAADIYAGRWDGSKYRESSEQQPPQVQIVKDVFEGEVVEIKQSTKLSFQPKGGATTPSEKKEIASLLNSKGADGKAIFTKDEIKAYSDMRKDNTASELISIIKIELQNRISQEEETKELDIY
ncbi:MAG: hypothetical protein ACTTJ6_09290 [Treponema sp.]